MKKILSLGVAAAVLSLTAIAASAAIAPTIIDDAIEGETITVEIVATGVTSTAAQFSVVASDNLTLDSYEVTTNGFAAFNNNKFAWASTSAPAEGEVLLTLVYTVDVEVGDEISVALTPDAGFEADVDSAATVAVVVAGEESTEDLTTEEPVVSTEEPTVSTEEPTLIETEEEPTSPLSLQLQGGIYWPP